MLKMPFDSFEEHMEYMKICKDQIVSQGLQIEMPGDTESAHMRVFRDYGNAMLIEEAEYILFRGGLDGFSSWLLMKYLW